MLALVAPSLSRTNSIMKVEALKLHLILLTLFVFAASFKLIDCFHSNDPDIKSIITGPFLFPITYIVGYAWFSKADRRQQSRLLILLTGIAVTMGLYTFLAVPLDNREEGLVVSLRVFTDWWGFLHTSTYFSFMAVAGAGLAPLVVVPRDICSRGAMTLFRLAIVAISAPCLMTLQKQGTRTSLIVVAVMWGTQFAVLLHDAICKRNIKPLRRTLTIALIVLGVAVFFPQIRSSESTLSQRMSRDATPLGAGGDARIKAWGDSLSEIAVRPFGGEVTGLDLMQVHNLWLDVAMIGGWIPFLALIGFTLHAISTSVKAAVNPAIDSIVRGTAVSIVAGIAVHCMVEPVDAVYWEFGVLVVVVGMLHRMHDESRRSGGPNECDPQPQCRHLGDQTQY